MPVGAKRHYKNVKKNLSISDIHNHSPIHTNLAAIFLFTFTDCSIPIADFQLDGAFSTETYMRHERGLTEALRNFTLCLRFKVKIILRDMLYQWRLELSYLTYLGFTQGRVCFLSSMVLPIIKTWAKGKVQAHIGSPHVTWPYFWSRYHIFGIF